jgi:3-hydroxyisobutyrate dehydrogenase
MKKEEERMKKTRIGFVGMGIMGVPMASHLSLAGYALTVYDNQVAAAEQAAREVPGAAVGRSPAEVAAGSDIVITMVPNGRVVREVALGDNGLIHGFRKGALLVDTSSSEPWITMETAQALAQKGVDMVDAPVSGARPGAEAGTLVFMVGGDKDPVDRATPLLKAMGEKIFHLGPVGSGHIMKCINNLITAMTFMATAEAMSIGKKCALDPEVMVDVLNASTGMSWISQTHIRQRILNRKFDDQFKLALMVKDVGIAMGLADSQNIPLPLCSVGHHLWRAAAGYAAQDASISNMVRWVEHMTGIELAGETNT